MPERMCDTGESDGLWREEAFGGKITATVLTPARAPYRAVFRREHDGAAAAGSSQGRGGVARGETRAAREEQSRQIARQQHTAAAPRAARYVCPPGVTFCGGWCCI